MSEEQKLRSRYYRLLILFMLVNFLIKQSKVFLQLEDDQELWLKWRRYSITGFNVSFMAFIIFQWVQLRREMFRLHRYEFERNKVALGWQFTFCAIAILFLSFHYFEPTRLDQDSIIYDIYFMFQEVFSAPLFILCYALIRRKSSLDIL
mmetsp:Transcript_12697/g.21380  ORF Transcript_12697/g.21380 Transcript_12697/m.21380 type:complete len:149 (+) Transcript_12697:794-1240(+)